MENNGTNNKSRDEVKVQVSPLRPPEGSCLSQSHQPSVSASTW